MSESAGNRSKRTFIRYLNDYIWNYQLSVFYQDYLDAQNAIEDSRKLRKAVIRRFPEQAFIWRIVLRVDRYEYVTNSPDKEKFVMPIHIFFTNNEIEKIRFQEFVRSSLSNDEIYVYSRAIPDWKINSYIDKVRKERPHDLKKYFNYSGKINRFSPLLNKRQAIKIHE